MALQTVQPTTDMMADVIALIKEYVKEPLKRIVSIDIQFDPDTDQIETKGVLETKTNGEFSFQFTDETWRHQPVGTPVTE